LLHIEDTFLWLSRRELKAEIENEIIAAQDQELQTKYPATKTLKTETHSKCRLCQQYDETIDHNTSECQMLAKEQYIKRHDRVCAQLHINEQKEIGVTLDKK
jgi:phosphoribosylformylglycinamidine (FGAM) synthase-like enzyme